MTASQTLRATTHCVRCLSTITLEHDGWRDRAGVVQCDATGVAGRLFNYQGDAPNPHTPPAPFAGLGNQSGHKR